MYLRFKLNKEPNELPDEIVSTQEPWMYFEKHKEYHHEDGIKEFVTDYMDLTFKDFWPSILD